MTIRDYLRRRLRLVRPLLLVWIFGVVGLQIAFPQLSGRHEFGTVLVWCIPAIAVLSVVFKRLKCPRCEAGLGAIANSLMNAKTASTIKFCPNCGVSFDEPYEASSGNR